MESRDEILEARDACSAAIAADPTSESGKAAAQKLEEMKPRIEEAERQRAEAERLATIERYKSMPAKLNDLLYEQGRWDFGRGTATPVISVIKKELGQPSGSYETMYGMMEFYVWGDHQSGDKDSARAARFSVEMPRGLTCADYAPRQVTYYSFGEKLRSQ